MKMNLKKCISFLLLLCLMIPMALPVSAAAGDTFDQITPKKLSADFGEAKFKDINLELYSRELGFENGAAMAADDAGKFGFVDMEGTAVVPHQYDSLTLMEEGLYKAQKQVGDQVLTGVINARGQVLVDFEPNMRPVMQNGIMRCEHYDANGYYLSMDLYHSDMTEAFFDEFDTPVGRSFNGYKYYFDSQGRKGILDPQGQVLIQAGTYDAVEIILFGTSVMFRTSQYEPTYMTQYLNADLQEVIPSKNFDSVSYDPYGQYFTCSKGNNTSIYDYTGKMMVPPGRYWSCGYFGKEGYFYAQRNGSPHSLIFHNGEISKELPGIGLNQNYYGDHIPGAVPYVVKENDTGLMDFNGNILIPASQNFTSMSFHPGLNGQILVKDYPGNKVQVYGADYKPIQGFCHHSVSVISDRWYLIEDGLSGLYDPDSGSFILPQEYNSISALGPHLFLLEKGQMYSLVDDQFRTIIAPVPNGIFVPGQSMEALTSSPDNYFGSLDHYLRYYYQVYKSIAEDRGRSHQTVIPMVSNSGTWENPVFRTTYVDVETGEVKGYLDCLASTIDAQGRFAYRADNGLMGLASLTDPQNLVPHLWVTGGRADTQNDAVVRVVLDGQQYFGSGQFTLNYDPSVCSVPKAVSLVPGGMVSETPGQVQFSWTADSAFSSRAVLELHFHGNSQSSLTLSDAVITNQDGSAQASSVMLHHGALLPGFIQLQTPSAENVSIREGSTGGLSVKADVAFAAGDLNMANKNMTATVIVAAYADGRMSLTSFAVQKKEITFDANGLAHFPVELTCRRDADLVKVFLLSSDSNLIPCTDTADIPIAP